MINRNTTLNDWTLLKVFFTPFDFRILAARIDYTQSYSFCCFYDYFLMRDPCVQDMCYSFIRLFCCLILNICEKRQNFWLDIDFCSFCHLNESLTLKIISLFRFSSSLLFTCIMILVSLTSVYFGNLIFLFNVYDVRKKRIFTWVYITESIDERLFFFFLDSHVMIELHCWQSIVVILGFNRLPFNKNS